MWAPAQRLVASDLACHAALYFLPPPVTLHYLHSSYIYLPPSFHSLTPRFLAVSISFFNSLFRVLNSWLLLSLLYLCCTCFSEFYGFSFFSRLCCDFCFLCMKREEKSLTQLINFPFLLFLVFIYIYVYLCKIYFFIVFFL